MLLFCSIVSCFLEFCVTARIVAMDVLFNIARSPLAANALIRHSYTIPRATVLGSLPDSPTPFPRPLDLSERAASECALVEHRAMTSPPRMPDLPSPPPLPPARRPVLASTPTVSATQSRSGPAAFTTWPLRGRSPLECDWGRDTPAACGAPRILHRTYTLPTGP